MLSCRVEPAAVADLALAPPRAALAVVIDDAIGLFPVDVTLADRSDAEHSPRFVRAPDDAPDLTGRDVVIVADDGPEWFRLRALTIRGKARPQKNGVYRVEPCRVVGWDFGSLREVPTEVASAEPQPLPAQTPAGGAVHNSAELSAALAAARVMIVATRSANGSAFAVPLWFVVHRGRIYADTAESSWTVRNIAATHEVAVLLGGERGSGPVLTVRAQARAVAGRPPSAVTARMALRYFVSFRFARDELRHFRLWGRRALFYGQSESAYVEISPSS
jgi:hypothetical protein